jgi:hypothetical protein
MQNGILDGFGSHTDRSEQQQTQQKLIEHQQTETQGQSPQLLDLAVVELQIFHDYDCNVYLMRICGCT